MSKKNEKKPHKEQLTVVPPPGVNIHLKHFHFRGGWLLSQSKFIEIYSVITHIKVPSQVQQMYTHHFRTTATSFTPQKD